MLIWTRSGWPWSCKRSWMTARAWSRWPPRHAPWPSPTPPAASLMRCWRPRDDLSVHRAGNYPPYRRTIAGSRRCLMSDWAGRRLHFIGIGGAGMSGLALVCARLGATVTGSDRADSSYMERLRAAGLDPVVGHDAANLPAGAE